MSHQKAERKKQTLVAIRQIFGRLKTYNWTSTRRRRTYEQQKKIKQIEGARYWLKVRQYKEIMKAHGWNEAAPTVIPESLRAMTPTSLQINTPNLPEPLPSSRSSFVFTPPVIHQNFITEDDANCIMAAEVQLYDFRASVLKRAPKVEWFRHRLVTYSWGQHRSNIKYVQDISGLDGKTRTATARTRESLHRHQIPRWDENICALAFGQMSGTRRTNRMHEGRYQFLRH